MVAVPKNQWRTTEEPYRSLTGSVYGSGAKEPLKNRWRTTEEPRRSLTGSVYGSGAKEPPKHQDLELYSTKSGSPLITSQISTFSAI